MMMRWVEKSFLLVALFPLGVNAAGVTFASGNALNMDNNKITGLGAPTVNTDAATMGLVNDKISSHKEDSSAHHIRYSNAEAVSAILAADGADSTLDADKVDGLHASEIIWAAADAVHVTTVLVSPVGTPTENGNALRDAVKSIPTPRDASSPYLIKIEPGVYDVGITSLNMLEYVDLEGSGEKVTKITGSVCGSFTNPVGTINSTNNLEMRFLTVENRGKGDVCSAIGNIGVDMTTLRHVTATAVGTGDYNAGIYNLQSDLSIIQSTASATGAGKYNYGIRNSESSPSIIETSATGSDATNNRGIYNINSSPTIRRSLLLGSGGDSSTGLYNATYSYPDVQFSIMIGENGSSKNYGMYNTGTRNRFMYFYSSTFKGATYSIFTDPMTSNGIYVELSSSLLEGPGVGGTSDFHCVYGTKKDVGYSATDSFCQ